MTVWPSRLVLMLIVRRAGFDSRCRNPKTKISPDFITHSAWQRGTLCSTVLCSMGGGGWGRWYKFTVLDLFPFSWRLLAMVSSVAMSYENSRQPRNTKTKHSIIVKFLIGSQSGAVFQKTFKLHRHHDCHWHGVPVWYGIYWVPGRSRTTTCCHPPWSQWISISILLYWEEPSCEMTTRSPPPRCTKKVLQVSRLSIGT